MTVEKKLIITDHPLIQHKLTLMRNHETPTNLFRSLLKEISILMTHEVFRGLGLKKTIIETPIQVIEAPTLSQHQICLVPIMRAGNGMLEGMIEIIPNAKVGHIGLYRDEETLKAHHYYIKLPEKISEGVAVVIDPMLATGNSANKAITILKEAGAKNIIFACLLSVPEGVDLINQKHPDVPIYTCCLDKGLNELGYIVPGLGDAGDRLYGTI
ncbi:uracil phosphoribosyltransferase [Rhodospirillaceae bacterium]|nr:uracil phosphoribosyltransferase [Rhodospirillaceae bacterium]